VLQAAGVTCGRLVGQREDLRDHPPSSGTRGFDSRRRNLLSNPKSPDHLRDDQSFLMEAAGVEPASANGSYKASTCVASLSISPGAVSEQPVPKLAT
ncbi:uncharacterized protein METZ01_LOCUS27224, partial [marine metagenome]